MSISRHFDRAKMFLGVLVALGLAAMAGIMADKAISSLAADDIGTAVQCSFIVPPEFVPGPEKGLFITESYPMDSSSIRYSYYDNGKDKVLTNREKIELQNELYIIEDMSSKLTKEAYQKLMSDSYEKTYGKDVRFAVSSFDNRIFDGFPGYCIKSDFKVGEEPTIYQDVYIILSKYRTFTITYQRAADDECEELFKKSAASIHVR